MSFSTHSTSYTVADYAGRINRKELTVNRDYQRSPEVWPVQARSFLIESMLLGYPIPKLYIREITDLATRSMKSEIVDGQQRSMAILHFLEGKFAISSRSELIEARGCRYDDLDEELKSKLVSYKLSADVLTGANDDEIIELFRRINSHTVSLNAEEQRHAQYQGEMKWFIYEISRECGPALENLGVFGVKQLARMQDAKFYADIVFALENGIRTTAKKQLDQLYKQFDVTFERRDEYKHRFSQAIHFLARLEEIAGTRLAKHYNFYSLLLAVMHVANPIAPLATEVGADHRMRSHDEIVQNLLLLDEILELDDPPRNQRRFWVAAREKTNTGEHRMTRFQTFLAAIASR